MKTQKKKWKSSHGAVTVFLAIVLLPCMMFVCAFGDVSRVQLSKAQAAVAADLSLYALMSNYDEDLKEWYGLVASCQDIDQFYDDAAEYFIGMMDANGIEGTAGEGLLSYISSLKSGDITDLLQIADSGTTSVGPVSNGTLRNPALLEDGIVEFMKYRGPVEMVTNVIDRFSSMDLAGGLGDAEKDEPIVKAKQEYAEAEGEMLEEMLATYLAILNYESYMNDNKVPKFERYAEAAEELAEIKSDFKKVTEIITNYYVATEGIKDWTGDFPNVESLPSLSGTGDDRRFYYNGNYYMSTVLGNLGATKGEDGKYTLTDAQLRNLLSGQVTVSVNSWDWTGGSYVSTIRSHADSFVSATNSVATPGGADDNLAIYAMQMQNAFRNSGGSFGTMRSSASSLMVLYGKVLMALECTLPAVTNPVTDTNWKTVLEGVRDSIKTCRTNYLSYGSATSDFEGVIGRYATYAPDAVQNVKNHLYTFYSDYCGATVTVSAFLEEIRSEYKDLYSKLQDQVDNINTILAGGEVTYNGNTYSVVDIDELKTLINNYTKERNEWGALAESGTTDYAEQEETEYNAAPGRTGGEQFAAALQGVDGETVVNELKTRLTNIRNDMQGLLKALDEFTYGGSTIYNMTQSTAISAAKTKINTSAVGRSVSENNSNAATYYSQLIQPSNTVYTAPSTKSGSMGNDPVLSEDIPELYQYMREAMKTDDLEKITDGKAAADKAAKEDNKKKENAEKEAKGVDNGYLNDLGKDPGAGSGGGSFGIGTAIGSVLGAVNILVEGKFGEYRDRLYVVEYAMDMFSYSSFNNEGQYQLHEKAIGAGSDEHYTLEDYDKTNKRFEDESYHTAWSTDDPKDDVLDNQSLTNRLISSANNYSNLAEVEYILFGKATNKENLSAAYGGIYGLRFVLNTVSGFQNFYGTNNLTGATINEIAWGVQATTCGIVPIPVTKVLLIGVLAALETAYDLARLKAGVPVCLYKAVEDWKYSMPGEGRSFNDLGEEPQNPNGLFYSDYIYLFMVMAAMDDEMYPDVLARIGDLIHNNMKMKNSDFDLGKATCYFTLNSTLQVKPLLITLPLMNNTYEDISTDSLLNSGGWCTYSVSLMRGYS